MERTAIPPLRLDRLYEPLMPELVEAFTHFIRSGSYILGPAVEAFEKAICEKLGTAHAIGCKSGTHSLILALKAAGVGKGHEVVTVANTYYATAEAIRAVGAMPSFAEIEPPYGLLDPAALKAAVVPGVTRAVIVVHLYGFIADMPALNAVCEENDLSLIEDCAHAFGSELEGIPVGSDSDFACFSLYPTKTLGAFGDAGVLTTRSPRIAERLRQLRYYADDETRLRFDPKAEHARLDPLQAHLLCAMLPHIDGWLQTRRKYVELYRSRLGKIPGLYLPPDPPRQVPALYSLPCFSPQRDILLQALHEEKVYLQVHYQTNLHRLPQFVGATVKSLPKTEQHNARVFNLPIHPSLTLDEVEFIASRVEAFFRRKSAKAPVL